MNSEKTLHEKFIEQKEYPIWYYKKLEKVNISYVILNLLKENFVVEINGIKHEITFGKNRKAEIGQCILYDDILNSKLTSHEVIEKGFRKGVWFVVSDDDTSDEFRTDYRNKKTHHEKEELRQFLQTILVTAINTTGELTEAERENLLRRIKESSCEELDYLVKSLSRKQVEVESINEDC